MRSEIPQLQVITAIADSDREDYISQLLFTQGWSIIFRAIDSKSLMTFISERGAGLRTVIIYQRDFPGFDESDFEALTTVTSTTICVDDIPMNSHLLMARIRSQLRLPLLVSAPVIEIADRNYLAGSTLPIPHRPKVVTVTGTSGAPGRSSIAFNIASQLTTIGEIELVDADFRAPSLSYFVGRSERPNSTLKLCELSGANRDEKFMPSPTAAFTVIDLGALPPLEEVVNDRRWQAALINGILEDTTTLIYLCKSSGLSLIRLEAFMNQFPILLRKLPIIYLLNQSGNSREDRALGRAFDSLTKGEVNFVLPSDPRSSGGYLPASRRGNLRGNSFTNEIDKIVAEIS